MEPALTKVPEAFFAAKPVEAQVALASLRSLQGYCADSWMAETQWSPVDWWAHFDASGAPISRMKFVPR